MKSSETLRHADWSRVTDNSKEQCASIFSVRHSLTLKMEALISSKLSVCKLWCFNIGEIEDLGLLGSDTASPGSSILDNEGDAFLPTVANHFRWDAGSDLRRTGFPSITIRQSTRPDNFLIASQRGFRRWYSCSSAYTFHEACVRSRYRLTEYTRLPTR